MKEQDTLAMELLHELKKSSKRNFIIAIILLIALVLSNLAWLIYESQWDYASETDTIEQQQEDTENSTMTGVIN